MIDTGLVDAAVMERLANDGVLVDAMYRRRLLGHSTERSPAPGAFVIVSLFDYRATARPRRDTLYERMLISGSSRVILGDEQESRRARPAHAFTSSSTARSSNLSAAGYAAMDLRARRSRARYRRRPGQQGDLALSRRPLRADELSDEPPIGRPGRAPRSTGAF